MSDWRKYIKEGVLLAHLTTDIAVKQTECGIRLDCDARKLLAAALLDPRALQAKLLDLTFDRAGGSSPPGPVVVVRDQHLRRQGLDRTPSLWPGLDGQPSDSKGA